MARSPFINYKPASTVKKNYFIKKEPPNKPAPAVTKIFDILSNFDINKIIY